MMRKSPGKGLRYVIRRAVPEGAGAVCRAGRQQTVSVAGLARVAVARRARFSDAMVNSIALNAKPTKTGEGSDKLLGGHTGRPPTRRDPPVAEQLAMFCCLRPADLRASSTKVGTRLGQGR